LQAPYVPSSSNPGGFFCGPGVGAGLTSSCGASPVSSRSPKPVAASAPLELPRSPYAVSSMASPFFPSSPKATSGYAVVKADRAGTQPEAVGRTFSGLSGRSMSPNSGEITTHSSGSPLAYVQRPSRHLASYRTSLKEYIPKQRVEFDVQADVREFDVSPDRQVQRHSTRLHMHHEKEKRRHFLARLSEDRKLESVRNYVLKLTGRAPPSASSSATVTTGTQPAVRQPAQQRQQQQQPATKRTVASSAAQKPALTTRLATAGDRPG